MTIYVCLDDRNGMLFNNRRQSRDAAVLEDILANLPGTLTIDPYSEKLIQNAGIPYALAPENASLLPPETHFFLETRNDDALLNAASEVVVYRWNRRYPADTYWSWALSDFGFTLAGQTEFAGRSHEKITKEVYRK